MKHSPAFAKNFFPRVCSPANGKEAGKEARKNLLAASVKGCRENPLRVSLHFLKLLPRKYSDKQFCYNN
jgi:hypothetical protein